MDVGNPSNFINSGNVSQRFEQFKKDFSSFYLLMKKPLEAMKTIYSRMVIAEPHGQLVIWD
jgi:hypothetical protein